MVDLKLFEYPKRPVDYNVIKQEKLSWAHKTLLSWPTNFPTEYEENNTVYAEYYWPLVRDDGQPTRPVPLAIFLHGWSGNMFYGRRLARDLASLGLATILLYQAFHRRRTPPALKKTRGFKPDAGQALKIFRLSVIDVRTALDLVLSFSDVDPERIAIGGVSLGALVGAITMAVDDRIKAGFFLLSGGNIPLIAGKSFLTGRLRRRALTDELKQEIKKSLASKELPLKAEQTIYEFLRELQSRGLKAFAQAPETGSFDPLNFADRLKDRPVMMINARFDRVIPPPATLQFWEAMGRPPLYRYPVGHFTLFFFYSRFSRKIREFLTAKLSQGAETTC